MDFRQLPLALEATVEPKYLDFLDHMNVMWYIHFFDVAVWNFYNSIGFGRDYHTKTGSGSFAIETHVRYFAELRAGDKFIVYLRALKRNAKLFHFIEFMVRAKDGELAATQELLGVHIDMSTRRSSPMPEDIGRMWDQLIAEHSKLEWEAPVSGAIVIASK
ncbi:MAG: thioesterase family protein [Anaerolineales bacterium]